MIFMSQSGITDPARSTEWAQWYVEHLRIMLTVEGIDSAVRLTTTHPLWPQSLALYSIRSAEVFTDPYYQTIRGMGPWLDLIDRRFYRRNLFEGVEDPHIAAPPISANAVLLVTDQVRPTLKLEGISFTWLRAVGLDQTTPYRGISVVPEQDAQRLADRADVALYK